MPEAVMLDACVLYPVSVRDTLLNMAEAGFFHVQWTELILTETRRNIVKGTPGLLDSDLDSTFDAMCRAFPEATISGYEHLIDTMTNHPKDRHVLAAAVHAAADRIVTYNLRDFPAATCALHGIAAASPDDLLTEAFETNSTVTAMVLRAQAARKRRPPMTTDEMLDRLATRLPNFTRLARTHVHAPR